MKRIIKAAAAQLAPVMDNCAATTEKVCDYIEKAGQNVTLFRLWKSSGDSLLPNLSRYLSIKGLPPL